MARRCDFLNKGVQSGNNVSHAHNTTRRRYLPNIQTKSLLSEALDEMVKVKISMHGLRSVEHKGGLDAFLLNTDDTKLGPDALKVKRRIVQKIRKDERRAAA
jgi:large subunit ribosomal protein L28